MSGKFFIDTNVLVYSFDRGVPKKRAVAIELVARALRTGSGVISWQVVQEFLHVARHKWETPMTAGDALELMTSTLEPLCAVFPSATLWRTALTLQTQSQYRFYDCLIVAAALQSGAKVLYSEDLRAGRAFGELTIKNPFV